MYLMVNDFEKWDVQRGERRGHLLKGWADVGQALAQTSNTSKIALIKQI